MDLVSEKLSEEEKSVTASEVKETKSPERIFNDLIRQSVQEIPEGEIKNPAKLRHNKIVKIKAGNIKEGANANCTIQ